MSGIAGIVHFGTEPISSGLIQTMTAAMAHRGPDGITHWESNGVALGQCMLHSTPESLQEQQPVVSQDEELVLVMDGRVDNWIELRTELLACGANLRNRSDSELVLQAFMLWGRGCLSHIEGDFALAIWNTRERSLFCARDPLGNKPLVYHWSGSTLYFASELQAILALPEISEEANHCMLAQWLASEWYSLDETFWKGIYRLVAAHFLVADSHGIRTEQYWSPDLFSPLEYETDQEYINHYKELFTRTVSRLSRSHKPLAAEVSGGLDSSAIFSVAEDLRMCGKLLAPELEGYTLNFEGEPDADEIAYCRAVADKTDRTIREIEPASPELSWYRDSAAKYRDFPGLPNGVMAMNLMNAAAVNGSAVLLNGVGGDEWLGGSRQYYAEEISAGRIRNLSKLFRQDVSEDGLLHSLVSFLRGGLLPFLPKSLKGVLRRVREKQASGVVGSQWLTPELKAVLKALKTKYLADTSEDFRWPGQRGELAMLNHAGIAVARESNEKFIARFGLELRLPFYTKEMVQFFFSVPKRMLYSQGTNKFTHREAMRDLLPLQVLERHSKAEFSGTYRVYLSNMEELLTREIANRRRKWVDPEVVRLLYANYGCGKFAGQGEFMLWVLLGCDMLVKRD